MGARVGEHALAWNTRGPTDVAFAGPERDVLFAASLDNLVMHRFDGVGMGGLKLNHLAT